MWAATSRCLTCPIPREDNPFLGERGIRVGLDRPEVLRTQLRAILRASSAGKVAVMFPMIATLQELRDAKAMLAEEAKALGVEPIHVRHHGGIAVRPDDDAKPSRTKLTSSPSGLTT